MPALSRRKINFLIVGVFILIFVMGLLVSADYGPHFDEPSEIKILQMNILEVAGRLFSEDSEIVYKLRDAGIGRISMNSDRDHGIAAYYPFALLLLRDDVLGGSYEFADISLPFHYYTFAICFAGLIAFYFLVYELFRNKGAALLSALILFASPRFFAEMHYNNKDVVLMYLLIGSCLFGIRAIKYRRVLDVLLYSLIAALAANTKIIGLYFFGVIGLAYILYISLHRQWNRRSIFTVCLTIASFLVLYYLLTPAMWSDPLGFFRHCLNNTFDFSRWSGSVVFEGTIYKVPQMPLPRSYIPKLIGISTPVFILLLALAGVLFLAALPLVRQGKAKEERRDQGIFIAMICLCALAPVLLAVFNPPVVYNGWRHFYFAYAGIMILAAYGLIRLMGKYKKITVTATVLCLVFLSVQNVLNHPNQQTYYNFLAGSDVESNYELDYWNVSTREGLLYVAERSSGDICVSSYLSNDNGIRWGLLTLDRELRDRISIVGPEDIEKADYVVENSTYQLYSGETGAPPGFEYLDSIRSYGNPIVNIYVRK